MGQHVISRSDGVKINDLTFQSGTPGAPANGDFWVSSNYVYVRTNSVTKNLSSIGAPGGSNTQIQFNNSSSFGGDSGFTTNGSGSINITGDLDIDNININGNSIISTDTDGNINITPNGDGNVVLDGLNWPIADSTAGYVLKTDGLGALYFGAVSGSGAFTADGNFAAFQGTYADAGAGSNIGSFAQGSYVTASGNYGSFAQGFRSTANGYDGIFAQGKYCTASGTHGAFAQGSFSVASGLAASFAQGEFAIASGSVSFAQGQSSTASGICSFSQGITSIISGNYGVFGQGINILATGNRGCFSQGYNSTAYGSLGCFVQGSAVTASANTSWAVGLQTVADKVGQFSRSTGRFSTNGDAQISVLITRIQTTNGTATTMTLDGAAEGAGNRITIPANTTWTFDILVVARNTVTDDENASFKLFGCIKKDATAGTAALVGSVDKTTKYSGGGSSAWDIAATADSTNGALKLQATGEIAHTINWVAYINLAEVGG